MFKFGITFNAYRVAEALTSFQRQKLPTIVAVAATRTAREDIIPAEKQRMIRVFDRPVPWTLNGMRVRAARQGGQAALIYWEDFGGKGTPAGDYLVPQVKGGARPHTRLEQRLIRAGVLPSDLFLVPGRSAHLNSKGNLNVGQITKIMAALGGLAGIADRGPNYRPRGKRADEVYIVLRRKTGNLRPGIYQRRKGALLPVFLFVAQPHYTPRFDFQGVARFSLAENYPRRFAEARAEVTGGKWKRRQ